MDILKIAFIASECSPCAKTGGLADVVGSLPKSLHKLGHQPIVIMPKYAAVDYDRWGLQPFLDQLGVWMGDGIEWCSVFVVLRIAATSPDKGKAWEIVRGLGGGLRHLADAQSNELIPLNNDDYEDSVHEAAFLTRLSYRTGMILNSEELVSLVHLPSITVRAEKLLRDAKKTKAAPPVARGHELVLGENVHQGRRTDRQPVPGTAASGTCISSVRPAPASPRCF